MKKLIMFLAGLILLAMAGVAVYVAGAIYDTGTDQRVTPYFSNPITCLNAAPASHKHQQIWGRVDFWIYWYGNT